METKEIKVFGMMCGHCEGAVSKAVNSISGVEEAMASHSENKVTIKFDPDLTSEDAFKEAILKEGYSLEEIKDEEESIVKNDLKAKQESEPKDSLCEISFNIEGMTCANCSLAVEKALKRVDGIHKTAINLPLEKGIVKYDNNLISETEIFSVVKDAGYNAVYEDEVSSDPHKKERRRFLFAFSMTIPIMIIMHGNFFSHAVSNYIIFTLSTLVQFGSGLTFYEGAWFSLKNRTANMDVLITLGISSSYFYSVYSLFFIDPSRHTFFDGSAMLITFILVGKMLEARAKGKTSEALKKLIALNPDEARVIVGSKDEMRSVSSVRVGDLVKVLPGEKVPVDGEVTDGFTTVDESMLTGESVPVQKNAGAKVTGATINQSGTIIVKTEKTGSDTVLSGIIKMVENAQADKAPIQRLADRISNIFVPLVVIAGISTFVYWNYFSTFTLPSGTSEFLFSFELMIAVFVISCPCALGLATPTAIMVGSGVGLNKGILFKKGSVLEKISKLDVILFDKTGTVTKGKPEVSGYHTKNSVDEKELFSTALALESNSTHPLALAVANKAEELGGKTPEITGIEEISGFGIKGKIDGKTVKAGNPKFFEDEKIDESLKAEIEKMSDTGHSVVMVSKGDSVIGVIALSDQIKDDSAKAVSELKKAGIRTALISGDNRVIVEKIAKEAGIDEFEAEVLPEDKIYAVKKWQDKGFNVGMVGDGINDAPAIAKADIGIAIGSGTDVAKETGDVVLVKNSLMDVSNSIRLGKKTLKTIKQNFFWAFFYNMIMIPVAAGILYPKYGLTLKPEFASIAMWLSSLSVVGNSLLIKRFERKM